MSSYLMSGGAVQGQVTGCNEIQRASCCELRAMATGGAPVAYSDRVVAAPAWLNMALVRANNLMALVYRNLINATLMSDKSARIKRELERLERAQGKLEAELTSHASNKDYAAIGGIPRKNTPLFSSLYLVQILMVVRFAAVCLYLGNNWTCKQPHVSYSKPSGSMLFESTKVTQPVVVVQPTSADVLLYAQNESTKSSHIESYTVGECARRLEEQGLYGRHNLDVFWLWNATLRTNWYLHLEQHKSLQMQRKEVALYNYLMGTMVATCGLFGCWLAGRCPFEIPPLVFIYEPQFVSARVRLRLLRYLRLVRRSYKNFWSSFALDWRNELAYRAKSWTQDLAPLGGGGGGGSSSSLEMDHHLDEENVDEDDLGASDREGDTCDECTTMISIARSTSELNQQQGEMDATLGEFQSYTPTARRQGWRRVLICAMPSMQLANTLTISTGILCLWLWFVYDSDVRSNMAMSEFLAGRRSELAAVAPAAAAATATAANSVCRQVALKSAGALRNSIITNYANALGLSERPSEVLERLMPIERPPVSYWLVPFGILLLSSLMISLYLAAFVLTISDLCFSLVELRLKLSVCINLLRQEHQGQEQEQQQQQQQVVDAGDATLRRSHSPREMELLKFLYERPTRATSDLAGRAHRRRQRSSYTTFERGSQRSLENEIVRLQRAPAAAGGHTGDGTHRLCNFELWQIGHFLLGNRAQKEALSGQFALRLATHGGSSSEQRGAAPQIFLMSTYLDLRLFLDQIDDCRSSLNLMIGFAVFHELNIIASSTSLDVIGSELGFMMGGFMLGNLGLMGAAFFQSQCSKLYRPIHSVLALSIRGDKMIRHLALLWRRALVDFAGPKSKFSFSVYFMRINYASVLQFNLSVISLYILALDKSRPRG